MRTGDLTLFIPNNINILALIDFSSKFFNFVKPELVRKEKFLKLETSSILKKGMEPYIPYFNFRATFSFQHTNSILEMQRFFSPSIDFKFIERLFKFAEKEGFVKVRL